MQFRDCLFSIHMTHEKELGISKVKWVVDIEFQYKALRLLGLIQILMTTHF